MPESISDELLVNRDDASTPGPAAMGGHPVLGHTATRGPGMGYASPGVVLVLPGRPGLAVPVLR